MSGSLSLTLQLFAKKLNKQKKENISTAVMGLRDIKPTLVLSGRDQERQEESDITPHVTPKKKAQRHMVQINTS